MANQIKTPLAVQQMQLKLEVTGHSNESFDIKDTQPGQVIYVSNCRQCNITVHSQAAKIVFEKCVTLNVTIKRAPITGVVEIIRCTQVEMLLTVLLPTIQVDQSQDVLIRYDSNAHVGTIVCHKDNNIRVAASAESEAETLGISESDEDQFITQYRDGLFVTEKVVREGAGGYIVTETQVEQLDRVQDVLDQFPGVERQKKARQGNFVE